MAVKDELDLVREEMVIKEEEVLKYQRHCT